MKKYRIIEEYWVDCNYPFYFYIIQRRRKFRFWKWVSIPHYIYKTYEEAEKRLKELEHEK
jgi:hypothetical protein